MICNCDCINYGLSAFSLGLIPSLRFVDVWGKVLGLLNKPLNCTSLSLYLFPRELGYATIVQRYISIIPVKGQVVLF